MYLKDGYIHDDDGTVVFFRGCNLGGDSKIPTIPDGSTHLKDSLRLDGEITFLNRPFPLNEADYHFKILKDWGFNFLRFVVTWEAIEPELDNYDEQYLEYVCQILSKASDYGFKIYIDPHQDLFSRFSGGDGAPAYAMESIGMDVSKIADTCAALLHQTSGKKMKKMNWVTNHNRYATATMFTLFFGGNTFAPFLTIKGENIQDWLQRRYIAAIMKLANKLSLNPSIIGFGSMNEPHFGFIGLKDLSKLENCAFAKGAIPTPFESMVSASGHPIKVNNYSEGIFGRLVVGKKIINKNGANLFKEGFTCPWKQAGVWSDERGVIELLKPDYFEKLKDQKVDFCNQFLKPFILNFKKELLAINDRWLVFIEGVPQEKYPSFDNSEASNLVHAFHWYDGATMVTRMFFPFFSIRADNRKFVFGKRNVIKSFSDQLFDIKKITKEKMANMPTLLGEFGVPFDLFGKLSYLTGTFYSQTMALSMYYDAIDENLLSATIWNYSASNNHKYGDNWNREDFSIYCKQDKLGKRATKGFVRPYAEKISGVPLVMKFDSKNKIFYLKLLNNPNSGNSTVIFLPEIYFSDDLLIEIFDKNYTKIIDNFIIEQEDKHLHVKILLEGEFTITVSKKR
ncbi:MAG: cellulase family glycosylhydrolase [Spirochaetes bacterium]|nr:cellulase family glycosylhydrolase [Spirochaetota bacterium]HOV46525.1 cellulase family glycosylhydrolase [Exilispira sp.]